MALIILKNSQVIVFPKESKKLTFTVTLSQYTKRPIKPLKPHYVQTAAAKD
jgi:hypothetical protein